MSKTLIVSDIHANLPALDAVLAAEPDFDRLLFLGDAVLAGPFPNETVERLRTLGAIGIMGNHDREVVEDHGDPAGERDEQRWMAWHRQALGRENLAWLESLPDDRLVSLGAHPVRLVHGELPNAFGKRLFPDSPDDSFRELKRPFPEETLLFGHSHIQFRKTLGGVTFINPGSAGTTYVGRCHAAYAVWEAGSFRLEAIPYPVERTVAALEARGQGVLSRAFVEDWSWGYRHGRLPRRYNLRDYSSLLEAGYR